VKITEEVDIELEVYRSPQDHVIVVHVDAEEGQRLRINLNDTPIWDGDPGSEEGQGDPEEIARLRERLSIAQDRIDQMRDVIAELRAAPPGESVDRYGRGDWDVRFSDDSDAESWWVEVGLFDPSDEDAGDDRTIRAIIALSDVEAVDLGHALLDQVGRGRERFRR